MDEITKHEERIRNRRRRRWKRRARILAPLASLPLLLGTLVLSVDIIEYAPQEPRGTLKATPATQRSKARVQTNAIPRPALATRRSNQDLLLRPTDQIQPTLIELEELRIDEEAALKRVPFSLDLNPE